MTPGYGHHPLVPTFYEPEPGPVDIRLKCLLSSSWSLTELEKCYLVATMSLLGCNEFQPYIVLRDIRTSNEGFSHTENFARKINFKLRILHALYIFAEQSTSSSS